VDPAKGDAQWLRVPHPSAASRLFVLAPLAELAPSLVPPGWGMSVSSARVRAEEAEGQDAVEAVADWDRRSGRWRDRSA
jgi:7,8-dihydro-6-hydroxymethylpterin-pyrophosphokinase